MKFENFEREMLEAAGFTCGHARAEYKLAEAEGGSASIIVYKAESWEVFLNVVGCVSEHRYASSLPAALFSAGSLFSRFHRLPELTNL